MNQFINSSNGICNIAQVFFLLLAVNEEPGDVVRSLPNSLAFIEYVLNTDLVTLKDGPKKCLINFNPLKSVVMANSNIHNYYGIELKYNGNILRVLITTNISELPHRRIINGQSIQTL